MEKQKTIFCGGGKKMGADWLKVTVHLDKVKEHVFEYKGKHYLKLNVNVKEQADQYGKDVSLSVDTYQPEEQKPAEVKVNESEDLPF
tara:strand:+ start:196 stop:456 length:261 start_codon:yes stop_codon:yes gene_type:complete